MTTFRIHESNIDRLEKKMNRIRTKCNKYGCGFHYAKVGEEFVEKTNDDGKVESIQRYIIVEAEGTAVINGWQFAATIDHTENGNMIRKLIEVELPERFRTCAPNCEHCNSKRHRKDTYIVYNEETKEFKQVGSSCLCDFTGGYSAELAAAYIEMFDELIKGDAPLTGATIENYYEVSEILRYAYLSVKYLGYVSTSSYDRSTKEDAFDAYLYDNNRGRLMNRDIEIVEDFRSKYNPNYNSEEVTSYVEGLLKYIEEVDDNSDFMHNLKVLVANKYAKAKELGYVVAMVPTYNKHLKLVEATKIRNEKLAKEQEGSQFVGEVGSRITVNNIDNIEVVTSWTNSYGYYATSETIRYKITDTNGNIYMWDSSTGIFLDQHPDGTIRKVTGIVGTIKKHDEFRGVKQTWLTRCKVQYSDPIKFLGESRCNEAESEPVETVQDALDDFFAYVNA